MKFVSQASIVKWVVAAAFLGTFASSQGQAQLLASTAYSSSSVPALPSWTLADAAPAAAIAPQQGTSASSAAMAEETPFHRAGDHMPFEFGALVQGGNGLTEDRDGFHFIMAGAHAGKVLYKNDAKGMWRGNFEYAVELFPYWQSFTPKFQRANCTAIPNSIDINCSALYTVGGTYRGVSVTPIILRWNFNGTRRISPWVQGAGGLIWTNHKYPGFGSTVLNLNNDGPNTDTSVWNFTPQFGVGFHYFIKPRRSIDFSANAVHISSASLGDKNPGVNASIQFTLGYTFWK
jgi:lipid A 3-O-deacylase